MTTATLATASRDGSSPAEDTSPPQPSKARQRAMRWLPWIAVGLSVVAFGTLAWLIYREFDDVMGNRSLAYAALFAAIPVVPLGAVLWWLNRENPERGWLLAYAFLWGGLAATYMSLHLNEWLAEEIGAMQAPVRAAVFVAPWTEEVSKAVILFAIVLWRRHRFNGVMAGVVLGALSGLGFAFTENILYYGQLLEAQGERFFDWTTFQDIFWWRGVRACFVHPLFTMATGFGLGIAVRQRNVGVRILAPVIGFCVAALLHMGYNAVASLSTTNDSLNAAYVGILLPTLTAALVIVWLAKRQERRAIAARLRDYSAFGWLPVEQVPYIVDAAGRRTARRHVRRMGKQQRRTLRAWQRCGLSLGVLRDRMVRGVAGEDERAHERAMIERFRTLRASVVLPGKPASAVRSRAPAASSW